MNEERGTSVLVAILRARQTEATYSHHADLSEPGVSPRRVLLLAGPLVALAAVAGQWQSARRAEEAEIDRADAALARSAAAYFSVVVPAGAANGYDPARLLSAVNNLERASFWPGGLQVALGAVPLLPDTIGLAPVPDSLLKQLDEGREAVILDYPRYRVALVPFLDRDRFGMLGWVAAWGAIRPQLPSVVSSLLAGMAAAWILISAVVFLRESDRRWRILAFGCALGFLAALAVELQWSVGRAARSAAEVQLLTLKRLIEVAATAPGVRQVMLPEIAVGLRVRPLAQADSVERDVRWGEDAEGRTVTVVAATPRTQGALELTLQPDRRGQSRLALLLAGWVGAGALGLGLSAGGARLRSAPRSSRSA